MAHFMLTVEPLSVVDEAALEEFYVMHRQAHWFDFPADPPACRASFIGQMVSPRPGRSILIRAAWSDGRPSGICVVGLDGNTPPTEAVLVCLSVHPDMRRQGVGRQLLAAVRESLGGMGPKKLTAFTSSLAEKGPGDAFSEETGAERVARYRRLALNIAERPRGDGHAVPAGYGLVRWRGGVPSESLEEFAAMSTRLAEDEAASSGNGTAETFDAAKVETLYAVLRAWGLRTYITAVRHTHSGLLVGYSALGIAASHHRDASQWDTVVLPAHRGQGLGALLKETNLSWAREHEPELSSITTWNAVGNTAMMAVNESFGFRADAWGSVQAWSW
ncbi:GNAT family N-acetyltransferase [Streptomyces sp. NPDC048639]|uniref:GNAT family N-acetyltransferase n=1 Tax=Streptomyces sp. NPDC048639 TaxID=3365581 RepID=UPI0037245F48